MANISGDQPDLDNGHCPRAQCNGQLRNVPRHEMRSRGYIPPGQTEAAPETHTYECKTCGTRFEINQHQ